MKPAHGNRLVQVLVGAGVFLLASLAGGLAGTLGRDWLARHGLPALALDGPDGVIEPGLTAGHHDNPAAAAPEFFGDGATDPV